MKLNLEGLRDRAAWQAANTLLPSYDVGKAAERTRQEPMWVHFGIGNIFRIFVAGIADRLLEEGLTDRGITCVETFDDEIVDRIFRPCDNLALAVTLHGDGTTERKILGSMAEAVKANGGEGERARLKEIFRQPSLQMVSFTITEKGYALHDAEGRVFPHVAEDLEKGPDAARGVMGIVTAMLYERYRAGRLPLALVSMDNVARNGEKLRASVLETARAWQARGYVEEGFLKDLEENERITFPWTMIDKITPRPSPQVAQALKKDGVEGMDIVVTGRETYIAPFVNAEGPEYLVVEDSFPQGRPPLEKAGVYMTDRHTVNLSERMKVTACLNPIHSALGPYDVMLGYELFADGMEDPELSSLARLVGYGEGLPMVESPGILSPKAFIDEVIRERFPNRYLGDTSQRICTDISMGVPFRFGETIRAYRDKTGTAENLTGIALAIAGWLRYLLGVDDAGKTYPLAPDPMREELRSALSGVRTDDPASLADQLKPVLANDRIWSLNLYEAGIGEKIEEIFRDELRGPGSVRETLKKYLPPQA